MSVVNANKQILIWFLVLCCVFFAASKKGSVKKDLQITTQQKSPHCPVQAEKGDTVLVHYTGSLENGKVFDTSKSENRDPFAVQLGAGKVIKGWEEGLLGICEGEIRKLVIPPHLGYGDDGQPPVIPGGATLTFIVECLKVEKKPWDILSPGNKQFAVLVSVMVVVGLVVYEVIKKARSQEDQEKLMKKEKKESRKKNRKGK